MKNRAARAFAPATVGNVGVGFDILGLALAGLGEIATVQRIDGTNEVIVEPVKGFPDIPLDPTRNTASAGLVKLIQDKNLKFGFRVRLEKSIPVGSGLGGSAASAVAATVAANALLAKKLSNEELIHYSLIGESIASQSQHADNIAPCLFGGLAFVRNHPTLRVMPIHTPKQLRVVLLLPNLSINTKEARQILSPRVDLKTVVEQSANLTGFILGCLENKLDWIRESLKDVMIEPQRAKLIPSFHDLQAAAMEAGALGCTISGSGPAIFALTDDKRANRVHRALLRCAKANNFELRSSWISPIARKGAHKIGGRL